MEDRKRTGFDFLLRLGTLALGVLIGCVGTFCVLVGAAYFLPPSSRQLSQLPLLLWSASQGVRESPEGESLSRDAKKLQSVIAEIAQLSFGESMMRPQQTGVAGLGGGRERLSPLFFRKQSRLERSRFDAIPLEQLLYSFDTLPLGSPVFGEIGSGYGRRLSPFSRTRQQHSGVDLEAEQGTSVVATAEGTVTEIGWRSSYGKTIIVNHGNGFETLFAHLADIQVRVGDRVCRGQQIGLVGASGMTTGPHLHYEVRLNGIAQNPEQLIDFASYLEHVFEIDLSNS